MIIKDEKILFIILDAFRYDYVNPIDTPFLYSKISKGVYVKKLRSSAGFTQRTAMFTGCTANESNAFTMFSFDSEESPFSFIRDHKISIDFQQRFDWRKLPKIFGLKKLRRKNIERYRVDELEFRMWIQGEVRRYAKTAAIIEIPWQLLPELNVSEDRKPIYLPGALDKQSIFDIMSENKITFEYLMYPVLSCKDDDVLEGVLRAMQGNAKVIFAQFSESDELVHKCGPSSPLRRKIAGEVDRKLRQIDQDCKGQYSWIVFGDHGMTDVENRIDVLQEIKNFGKNFDIQHGRDYWVFLDSTMARFRYVSQKGKQFLDDLKESIVLRRHGIFVDKESSNRYGIPLMERTYGDLIWCANLGVLICPDYFHPPNSVVRGMHGYDSSHEDMKGFLALFGPNITHQTYEEASLIDVCPTFSSLVRMKTPSANKGVSLLCR